eukprot:132694-Heterocapsa_arctica.AAC.1
MPSRASRTCSSAGRGGARSRTRCRPPPDTGAATAASRRLHRPRARHGCGGGIARAGSRSACTSCAPTA